MRKWTSLTTAAAVVITSLGFAATPAEARHRHGGGWGGYRHHDGVDAGDVIGGILILGTIAAIAGAASRNREVERRDRDYRYEPPYRGEEPQQDGNYQRDDDNAPTGYAARTDAENRASDACNWAVEGEIGGDARVDSVDDVVADDDGYRVTGSAATDGDSATRQFACTFRGGRVTGVEID